MKKLLYISIYLYIYTCFFFGMNAQELTLSIKAEKPISQGMKDSLRMNTSFEDFTALKKETDTVYLKLQRMGYIESEMLQLQKENDSSYTANFYFGKKYNELKVFYSEENFNKKEIQRVSTEITDTYFILPFETIPNSLRKLTALRNQKGNAFARLRLTEFEKDDNNKLSAALFVDNGNIRTVDSIAIKGYEKFPRSFLKYYAGVKKGKLFNQKKLVEQSENLNSLGFVSAIKPPEALFRKDSTTVYFYLEKQNNNLFDGILGFATDEETQKLTFNGYLNLELNNNLNYGEQLLLNYKADGKEQVNFRVKATLPYLLKTPFGLSGELKIFKRDSTFITTEQQVRATYQINPKSTTYIGYKGYDSSNLLDIAVAGTPVEDFKSKFFIAGASYIKPQNKKLFPIKTIISLDGGLGARDKEGNSDDQIRIETLLNNIFNLNYQNSIFVQNLTSVLFSDSYLVNELFRFGGINSMRGFNENSIDASLYSVINTEYRYQFNDGVYVHSIIDVGYFENETLLLKQNLYSFGLGLGLNTKAGLFKFNVANGNTKNQDFSFSNTKIHISISSKF
ncbi:POTRA domain-containing protein [Aequorivita antarctica]|uniref:POTRA domain-containing protein n=1 Tax=Aequorivita antarctica TaxID=153266 RepID=UPI00135754F8|nr:POTRA domain-containing protein [Aequorivita antarctica]